MAGGRGQRLRIDGAEKPLLEYKRLPLFAHVYAALARSKISATVIVTSPHTPRTTLAAKIANLHVIEAPGEGYIEDYRWTIARLQINEPVLIVAADLPRLNFHIIDKVIDYYAASDTPALAVYVPRALCSTAGPSANFGCREHRQTLIPAAVNVIDGRHVSDVQQETILVVDDEALLYNVNTVEDLKRLVRNSVA